MLFDYETRLFIDRLQEDFDPNITLDEETIAQAIEDAKKLITEILKNV